MITLHHIPSTYSFAPTSEEAERTGNSATTTATAAPFVSRQGEARWYGDSLWEFLVPSAVTNGTLSVLQATMPEGFSPPRHIHTREDEAFLVMDGEVWFDVDGERHLARPGASVYMPRGVPHTFRVESPVARLLGVISPGAFEQLFLNLSIPADERALPGAGTVPFDASAVMAEQTRLGTEVVGPPMAPVAR